MPSLRNLAYFLVTLFALLAAYLAVPLLAPPNHAGMPPLQRFFTAARSFPRAASVPHLLKPLASPVVTPRCSSPFTTSSSFSTSSTMTTNNTTPFSEAVAARRTVYTLNKTAPIDDKKLTAIIEQAVHDVPSTFNSQSTRLLVLLKEEHNKFWDIVHDILKAIVPAEKFEGTAGRIAGFRAGYGSILFYEAPEPTKQLQTNLPEYADKFPVWAEHTSAMHQYEIWTALHEAGFGANLQHYNPLPDQKVAETWNIPLDWSLKAQLVFGGRVDGWESKLQNKTFQPISERLFIHGA